MNYLGFNKEKVAVTVEHLNLLLANYQIYYQNLRNFHWNIRGENFFELHEQFELLYHDARVKIDEIAERILTLRHRPLSLLSDYLEKSEIPEAPSKQSDREMVMTVLDNHKILIGNLRKTIKSASEASDEGTIDMVGSFLENLEKKSWMLDAWSAQSSTISMN